MFVSVIGFLGYYDGARYITFPTWVVLGLQMLALVITIARYPLQMFRMSAGVASLISLAFWAALTLLWADDQSIALKRWLLIFVPAILLALLAAVDEKPERSFAFVTWLFVVITIASYVFSLNIYAFGEVTGVGDLLRFRVVELGGWTIGVSEGGRQYLDLNLYIHRFSGFTSNPNSFALFAGLSAIALSAIIKRQPGIRRCLEIATLVVILIILVLSASRAAVAMAFAGIVVVILLRADQRRLARLCVVGVVALTCLLYLAPLWQGGVPAEASEEIFDLRERANIWRLALSAISQVWMTGVGFGLTQEAVFAPLGTQSSAHSVPLSMLLETGVVGLLLLLVTWFLPVFGLTKANRQLGGTSIAIVALLIALFVHQVVDSSVFRYHWAHFVFVYLIGASSHLPARESD
jgi:hypothetical protein